MPVGHTRASQTRNRVTKQKGGQTRNGEVQIQSKLLRGWMETEEKKKREIRVKADSSKAPSQVADRVFGILGISFNLAASLDREFAPT